MLSYAHNDNTLYIRIINIDSDFNLAMLANFFNYLMKKILAHRSKH